MPIHRTYSRFPVQTSKRERRRPGRLRRSWIPGDRLSRGRGASNAAAGLGGFLFVTTDPDRVSPRVLECVDRLPVVGQDAVKSLEVFCRVRAPSCPGTCRRWRQARSWCWAPVRGQRASSTPFPAAATDGATAANTPRGALGKDNSFYFHGPEGKLNLRAHNHTMFVDLADGVDEATWEWHRSPGDYSE